MTAINSKNSNEQMLTPPGRLAGISGHHWVEGFDFDGRSTGIQVLQWQPGVKAWCHSGMFATGQEIHLEAKYNIWMCEAPTPDLENHPSYLIQMRKLANQARRELKETGAITGENLKAVEQLLMMISDPM